MLSVHFVYNIEMLNYFINCIIMNSCLAFFLLVVQMTVVIGVAVRSSPQVQFVEKRPNVQSSLYVLETPPNVLTL